jgi:hypothetical protein
MVLKGISSDLAANGEPLASSVVSSDKAISAVGRKD